MNTMLCGRYHIFSKILSIRKFHQSSSRMLMHNPQMYEKYNEFQKRDASDILQKYKEKINWKPNAAVVDLGCGDGLVNQTVLKQHIPKDFKELVGLDVSKEMIEYAEAKYGDDRSHFFIVDLGKKLPEKFKGRFDHAFSCHALHFISDQVQLFTNVHDLLKDGGNFLAIMLRENPYLHTYRIMAKDDRWKDVTKTADQIMPNVFADKNYQDNYKTMLKKIGFKECSIIAIPTTFEHEKTRLRGLAESANFFKIDTKSQLFTEFFDDFMERFFKVNKVENVSGNFDKFRVFYTIVLIYGRK